MHVPFSSLLCHTSGSFQPSHTFGGLVIPILMDYVNCSGSEFRLWDCLHFTHSYSGCSHSDDAGVRCQPGIEWFVQGSSFIFVYMERVNTDFSGTGKH